MEPVEEVQETKAVDLADLLDDGDNAVVTLVTAGTRLAAHRAVLAARSPILAARLSNGQQEDSSGQVVIPDVDGPVLRQLLAYLYTLKAPQLPGMVPQLLAAAEKYGVSSLKVDCEQQVIALQAAQQAAEEAMAAAVCSLRHAVPSLTETDATNLIKTQFQSMVTQHSPHKEQYQRKEVVPESQFLTEPLAETSAPSAPGIRTTAVTHRQPDSDCIQTPAAAAPPTVSHHGPQPNEDAVTRMRCLSRQEKGRRLIQAAEKGTVEDLRALLMAGADLGARDGGLCTALHWAAKGGHVDAAKFLLEHKAEVGAKDILQNTPLHWAAYCGHTSVVQLLVAFSADPNARSKYQRTPLHYAVECGHAEAVAALLKVGAQKRTRDEDGNTPLDLAVQKNKYQLIEMLVEN